MKPNLVPWEPIKEKPEIQLLVQSFLLANLPLFHNVEQIGHRWTLRHPIAAQFMNAKIHGDWQFFLNELSAEDTMAIYEAIIVVKTLMCESKCGFTFMGDA